MALHVHPSIDQYRRFTTGSHDIPPQVTNTYPVHVGHETTSVFALPVGIWCGSAIREPYIVTTIKCTFTNAVRKTRP